MNVLFAFLDNSLFLDVFGVLGLGLVGLAAIKLATRTGSVGGSIMTWGVLALVVGRLGILLLPSIIGSGPVDPALLAIARNVPMVLLTVGLGALVWGFWSLERAITGVPASSD